MPRTTTIAVGFLILLFAGCGSSSSGSEETEPSFEDADALAREMVDGCTRFEVDDNSTDENESKSLDCYYREAGQDRYTSVLQYERDLNVEEIDALIPGFTTGDRYFQNGNITVSPTGQSTPGEPALDEAAYSEALKEQCGCGEVLTPET